MLCIRQAVGGSNGGSTSAQQCKADRLQAYVGQKLTPDVEEKFGWDSIGSMVRFIKPNQAMMKDSEAGLVNVYLDKNDRIVKVSCE